MCTLDAHSPTTSYIENTCRSGEDCVYMKFCSMYLAKFDEMCMCPPGLLISSFFESTWRFGSLCLVSSSPQHCVKLVNIYLIIKQTFPQWHLNNVASKNHSVVQFFLELFFCETFLCHFFRSLELAVEVSGACPTHPAHHQTCVKAHFIWTIPLGFTLSANDTMQYNEHIVFIYLELYAGMCFAAPLPWPANLAMLWTKCVSGVFAWEMSSTAPQNDQALLTIYLASAKE